jgi:hypothetical protein
MIEIKIYLGEVLCLDSKYKLQMRNKSANLLICNTSVSKRYGQVNNEITDSENLDSPVIDGSLNLE